MPRASSRFTRTAWRDCVARLRLSCRNTSGWVSRSWHRFGAYSEAALPLAAPIVVNCVFAPSVQTDSVCPAIPSEDYMYAIIETGGKQYRVAPGDVVRVEKLAGDVGSEIELPAKAYFQEGGELVAGGRVKATIVGGDRADKII